MDLTKSRSRTRSNPQVTAPDGADSEPDRRLDSLLTLAEVVELKRTTEASERWHRHCGRASYLFRLNGRLVAWQSDVIADIERQRSADQADS